MKYGRYEFNDRVNCCPQCKQGIQPITISYIEDNEDLVVVERCPLCEEIIISKFYFYQSISAAKWYLKSIYPISKEVENFSDDIKRISSDFTDIYNQAKMAESHGLKDICGVGYRKALEFLVKDYAKAKYPDEVESINKRPLKQCIEAYIQHPRIKNCILGATYLGNDETHYIKKIEGKDIEDLKNLIRLSTLWIDMDEATSYYEQDPDLKLVQA